LKKSPDSTKPHKVRKLRVLTKLEKLEGQFPGIATEARQLLDQGVSGSKVAAILSAHFPVTLTESTVRCFRVKRWGPQKDKVQADFNALEVFFKKCGGNYGLDLAAFARVHELMNTSDIKEANAVRLAVLKIRAQDLKEEEFKSRADQLKPGKASDAAEEDPAAEEAKTKRVMNKIRGIFGLDPLPDDTGDDELKAGGQGSEVVSQAKPEAAPSVDEGVEPTAEGPESAVPAGTATESPHSP
jgi:hypothetical protein